MVIKTNFSRKFEKDLKRAPKQVQIAFKRRLALFLINRNDFALNNHSLVGEYKNYRSINVTSDWRALFREFENGEIAYFDFLGTHSKLYG